MIHYCALAVIAGRGQEVILPSANTLDADEAGYIQRHVEELRRIGSSDNSARGRFRRNSSLRSDCSDLLTADETVFLDTAARFVQALAASMKTATNPKDCVVALVLDGPGATPTRVTLLKLDAIVEAAQLEKLRTGGIRLHVFRNLLPKPGKLQKGWSWPDPRSESEIIFVDRNVDGTTLYFQNAYQVDASAPPLEAEKALVEAIAVLPPEKAKRAAALAREGGSADAVVARIRDELPEFQAEHPALGSNGRIAGRIRPPQFQAHKKKYSADGVDLLVPLDKLDRVTTVERGGEFVTTIVTSTPLTPLQ